MSVEQFLDEALNSKKILVSTKLPYIVYNTIKAHSNLNEWIVERFAEWVRNIDKNKSVLWEKGENTKGDFK